ncbi:putative oxidoreductase (fatty acid repression mutant protein) [Pectinatus brassicae]|uniref:Putative oxidoreductase (Fatty acid repression mutant protein) n=1 Tax=Pectinatus brassicae TaxID=862415 RepID=A0A840UZ03_9FIRM|nr:hypothetical protein [Pectinatus brassicae]MBB5337595.1 putative oxidoreductase (fatty acid repression mutant protein) [Pectinatus brassicae]
MIDDKIKADFSVPDSWKLIAQMPFGQPLQAPAPIEKMTIGSRVRIYA